MYLTKQPNKNQNIYMLVYIYYYLEYRLCLTPKDTIEPQLPN